MSAPGPAEDALPPIVPITVGGAAGSSLPVSGAGLLCGYSLRETSGAAAALVQLFDGGNTAGQAIADIALAPGESVRDLMPGEGVVFDTGLFVAIASGAAAGAVWVRQL